MTANEFAGTIAVDRVIPESCASVPRAYLWQAVFWWQFVTNVSQCQLELLAGHQAQVVIIGTQLGGLVPAHG